MLITRDKQSGFTLVELLLSVAIGAILLGIGVPQMGNWIRRVAVVNASESLQNGLRLAQSEAIRTNSPATFRLVDVDAAAATVSTGASGSTTGWRAWIVIGVDANRNPAIVHRGEIAVDSPEVTRRSANANLNSLTFTGLGQVRDAGGTPLSATAVYSVRNTAPTIRRARCVTVSSLGAVKMCNPDTTAMTQTVCEAAVIASCPAP